jgi:hypothetical protein
VTTDGHGITTFERELMDQELEYVPLQTLSPYHVVEGDPSVAGSLAAVLESGDRYPLLSGGDHREAQADWLVWRSEHATGFARIVLLLGAGVTSPSNIAVRHSIKLRLRRLLRSGPR